MSGPAAADAPYAIRARLLAERLRGIAADVVMGADARGAALELLELAHMADRMAELLTLESQVAAMRGFVAGSGAESPN